MRQAILHGESTDKIAERIRRVMANGAYNARRIAQTERTRIQSQARYEQMLQLAARVVRLQKKWVARMDKRTRDTHAELNGTIIGLQERFSNGLLYPSGPAKEIINCRCVLIAVSGTAKALPASPKHDILRRLMDD